MGDPQLENGFTRIANEILEALARTKLNTQESRVVYAILRKTYGFGKKADWISNSQLELITGIHRSHCANTITRLLQRKIVTKTGNKIQFNKRYNSWVELLKQVTKQVMLPKQVQGVTQTGNQVLPKQVHTKETITKETIQKKEKVTNKFADNSQEVRLSQKLMNRIIDNNPSHKFTSLSDFELERKIQSYGGEVDKMIRLDNRTYEQINALIDWSQQDQFWQSNILSMSKLRKQFDTLAIQMKTNGGQADKVTFIP